MTAGANGLRNDQGSDSPTRQSAAELCVLLIVDMINPLQVPNATHLRGAAWEAAQHIKHLKAQMLARHSWPSSMPTTTTGTGIGNFQTLLQECQALRGRPGEIARLLAPGDEDLKVLKQQHSAFHYTPLEHLLKAMKTRAVVIAGVATDMWVQVTAQDARMNSYKMFA